MRPREGVPVQLSIIGHAAIIALLVVISVQAVGAFDSGQAHVEIEVQQATVDDGGNVTAFGLLLTNRGDEPVDPVFSVPSQSWSIANPWTVAEGPDVLEPGETAVYRIEAPGERAEPLITDRATIMVLDRGQQRRSDVGPVRLYELIDVDDRG